MTPPLPWAALAAAAACSLLVSLAVPIVLRPLLRKFSIVDIPNERSSHSSTTLRGGGIAPLFGALVTCGVVSALHPPGVDWYVFAVVMSCGVASSLLGLGDDFLSLPAVVRGLVQLAIGIVAGIALASYFGISSWWVAVVAFVIAAQINFTNFMDGVNAMSGLHGLAAGVGFVLVAFVFDTPWLALVGVIVATGFGAFLFWNLKPPGLFLGDVGSYLLGGLTAAAVAAGVMEGLDALALAAPFAIYWADTVSTIVRRSRNQESILKAHRTHTYQRLTDTGLGHVAVSGIVTGFTVLAVGAGLLESIGILAWPLALIIILGLAATYLALPRLRGNVLPKPIRAPLVHVELPGESSARPTFAPTNWAVIGASGFVGSAVADHLEHRGFVVRRLSAPRLELDPSVSDARNLVPIANNHVATEALTKQLAGVDVVVNAAGLATPDGGASLELFGANALLPVVVATAADRAGVTRMIHASSAAVQGRRVELDESADASTFTPYSRSKALGERGLFVWSTGDAVRTNVVTVRATSVQGTGRPTTKNLQRIARSPIASVASPGTQPTVVSSIGGLVAFMTEIGLCRGSLQPLYIQPWEGMSVAEVLTFAGGRPPRMLPKWLCSAMVFTGRCAGALVPELAGAVRRVELMWMGQRQVRGAWEGPIPEPSESLESVLRGQSVTR